jgi:hypothetical protein
MRSNFAGRQFLMKALTVYPQKGVEMDYGEIFDSRFKFLVVCPTVLLSIREKAHLEVIENLCRYRIAVQPIGLKVLTLWKFAEAKNGNGESLC